MAHAAESAEDRRAVGKIGGLLNSVFQNNIAIVAGKVLDKLLN